MVILGSEYGKDMIKPSEVINGEIVTFLDEGNFVENTKFPYPDGNPRKDFIMHVKYKGVVRQIKVNKFSRDELIKEYGNDTIKWVGKEAQLTLELVRALNKKCIVLIPFTTLKAQQLTKEKNEIVEKVLNLEKDNGAVRDW